MDCTQEDESQVLDHKSGNDTGGWVTLSFFVSRVSKRSKNISQLHLSCLKGNKVANSCANQSETLPGETLKNNSGQRRSLERGARLCLVRPATSSKMARDKGGVSKKCQEPRLRPKHSLEMAPEKGEVSINGQDSA